MIENEKREEEVPEITVKSHRKIKLESPRRVSLESRLYRTAAIAASHDAEKNLCAAFGFWDNPGELGEKSAAQHSALHCVHCVLACRGF